MERKVFRFAGRHLSYLAEGGEGTPVVFLHGLTNAATAWPSLFDAVASRPCIALDLPGHGGSDRFDSYGYDVDRDAVLALLDEIGSAVVLVGHSMGGLAACAAAAEQPEAVAGLYLEDVTPLFLENPARRSFALLQGVFSLPSLVGEMNTEGHQVSWLAEQIGTFRHDEHRSVSEALPASAVQHWAEQAAGVDVERVGPKLSTAAPSTPPVEQLQRFTGPAHVAHGDPASGSMVQPSELDTMRAINPPVTATRFEGGGHLLHAQFPTRFADDLASFVHRVDPFGK